MDNNLGSEARGGGTPPDSIAFVSSDPRQVGSLARVLRRAVGEVASVGSLRGLLDGSAYALVAVHYDSLTPQEQAALTAGFADRARRPTLLLLSERCAHQDFVRLFGSHALTNMLVITESGVDVPDLLVTVQKLRRGEIFGLEKYFAWGVEPVEHRITSSGERAAVLAALTAYVGAIGIAPRLRAMIRTAADEFLTNAIYNAPVHPDGTARFATCPRTRPVSLDPGEAVEVRYCCDGRRFGISITDPFGSLAPTQVQDYLARGFSGGADQMSEADGGAGLGFFQILDALSHLVVNLDPGRRTEMIGLLDVSGGYRNVAAAGKSFNIFVRGREAQS